MTHGGGLNPIDPSLTKEGSPIKLSARDLAMAKHIQTKPVTGIVDPTGRDHQMQTAGAIADTAKRWTREPVESNHIYQALTVTPMGIAALGQEQDGLPLGPTRSIAGGNAGEDEADQFVKNKTILKP